MCLKPIEGRNLMWKFFWLWVLGAHCWHQPAKKFTWLINYSKEFDLNSIQNGNLRNHFSLQDSHRTQGRHPPVGKSGVDHQQCSKHKQFGEIYTPALMKLTAALQITEALPVGAEFFSHLVGLTCINAVVSISQISQFSRLNSFVEQSNMYITWILVLSPSLSSIFFLHICLCF